MTLEPSINVTHEGSLIDIPTVVKRETKEQVLERETLGTSSETAYMEFPNTQVKTLSKEPILGVSKTIQGTKEASKAEVLASTRQLFAAIDQRNMNTPARDQITPVEVHERDNPEVLEIPTTTVVTTTTSVTTPLIIVDTELIGMSSPRISLPKGSSSHPTVTATCRLRTWMQQLTEGQTNVPRREDVSFSESNTSVVETLPEDIPDEFGHEWRVLHPFDIPGVRFPTDTMPPNHRRLAENDALEELIQTTEYLDDVPTWGQRDYRLYPPQYGDPFIEGEVEEEVEEVEEEENGFRKERWKDPMEVLEEEMVEITMGGHNNQLLQIDLNQQDRKMSGLCLLLMREEIMWEDNI